MELNQQNGEETGKSGVNTDKNVQKSPKKEKNMEKVDKNVVIVDDSDELRKQQKRSRALNRMKSNKPKTTKQPKKEVTSMRAKREKELEAFARSNKLTVSRINPKSTSKSGIGALRCMGKDGKIFATVRDHDIVISKPVSSVGYGKTVNGYPHLAVLAHGDDNFTKALNKGYKVKKSQAEWEKELGFVPRSNKVEKKLDNVKAIKERKSKLEAELKELRAAEKKVAKPKKKGKSKKAITKVAAQTA